MHSSKLKYIALALTLAFTTLPTLAAGLGKLNVFSSLGEPLRADIELLSVTPEELSTISAVIANNEAYQSQGIDKPSSHNDIRIEITKNARGEPILKLKSNKPMTDAFLDMLIQVDWSTGRLLREYTLLLDPPGYTPEVAQNIQTPVLRANSDMAQARSAIEEVTRQPIASGAVGKSKAARKSNPQPLASDQDATSIIASVDGQEYFTQRGDTLAKIASEMKPEGVSLDQMLIGLFQANPNAFDGNNMNRLKVGQIIRAPSQDQLVSIPSQSASKQVRIHSANWNAYKNKLAGIVADSQPLENDVTMQSSQGKVTMAEDRAAPLEAGPKDVVKLSAGEKVSGDAKLLQDKISALQEETIAKDNALKEAESRAADLERQISDMNKLLALKSDAMAKMQEDASSATSAVEAKPEAEAGVDAVALETQKVETPSIEPSGEVAALAPTVVPEASQPVAPPVAVDPFFLEEPSLVAGLAENLDVKTLSLGAVALALMGGGWLFLRNKRKKNLASFEEGIMTSGGLKANTVFGNTAGGTVDTGDTSFLTDFGQSANGGMIDAHDVDPIAEAEVYMAYGRDAQAEEILKDAIIKEPKRYELHLKLLEIYQTNGNNSAFEAISGELYTTLGAADPVWEKVAQLGVKLDPSNPLYVQATHATKSGATHAFAEAADDKDALFASLDQSTTLEMPSAFEPDVQAALDDLLNTKPNPELGLPMEFDLAADTDSSSAEAPLLDMGALDFSVSEPTLDDTPVISNADTVQLVDAPMTLDAPSIFAEPEIAPTEGEDVKLVDELKEDNVDFSITELNLDLPDLQVEDVSFDDFDVSKLDVPTIDFPTLEMDEMTAPVLDIHEALSAETATEAKAVAVSSGNEETLLSAETVSLPDDLSIDGDFKFDDEPNIDIALDVGQAGNFGFSEISLDLDDDSEMALASLNIGGNEPEEVETKLDLVMAYLDMEDKIGAKELLEEVLKEGGENQRKRATELLEKIA